MIELLIYDKEHWMDEPHPTELGKTKGEVDREIFVAKAAVEAKTPQDLNVMLAKDQEKRDARYQRGDIVEVRQAPFWTGPSARNFNRNAFCVVLIDEDGMDEADFKFMEHPLEYRELEDDPKGRKGEKKVKDAPDANQFLRHGRWHLDISGLEFDKDKVAYIGKLLDAELSDKYEVVEPIVIGAVG